MKELGQLPPEVVEKASEWDFLGSLSDIEEMVILLYYVILESTDEDAD